MITLSSNVLLTTDRYRKSRATFDGTDFHQLVAVIRWDGDAIVTKSRKTKLMGWVF